jgi:hypothetical protein
MPFSVTGKVIDENGKIVQGASICIKKEDATITHLTKENCITSRFDGSFLISTTNPNTYIIVVYIGYLPRVVHIKDAGLIQLEPNWEMLNRVFRIGSTI